MSPISLPTRRRRSSVSSACARCGSARRLIALVTPDGAAREVADGLAFPNGMAISPDGATLIVAESYGNRLTAYDIGRDGGLGGRRTWADTPGDHPGRDLRGLRGRRLVRRRRQPALRPGA